MSLQTIPSEILASIAWNLDLKSHAMLNMSHSAAEEANKHIDDLLESQYRHRIRAMFTEEHLKFVYEYMNSLRKHWPGWLLAHPDRPVMTRDSNILDLTSYYSFFWKWNQSATDEFFLAHPDKKMKIVTRCTDIAMTVQDFFDKPYTCRPNMYIEFDLGRCHVVINVACPYCSFTDVHLELGMSLFCTAVDCQLVFGKVFQAVKTLSPRKLFGRRLFCNGFKRCPRYKHVVQKAYFVEHVSALILKAFKISITEVALSTDPKLPQHWNAKVAQVFCEKMLAKAYNLRKKWKVKTTDHDDTYAKDFLSPFPVERFKRWRVRSWMVIVRDRALSH